jgi:hypothetical protein
LHKHAGLVKTRTCDLVILAVTFLAFHNGQT